MEALYTFLGAAIGGIIGFAASWLTLKYNYKRLFAETVSSNRMDWINRFREEFSIVIGTVICNTDRKNLEGCNNILIAEQARARLLTRLNMHIERHGNEYNKVFAERLIALDLSSGKSIDDEYIQKLIELSRKILEPEWQRVKKEAKGEQK